jgi:5-methyltetrahydropteroyltriglutamate--homocysteine methyltransferase
VPVPGIISYSTKVVEHPDLVSARIVRLAQLVGRESVIAGTDSGFAQGPFYRRVHPSIMWRARSPGRRRTARSRELWASPNLHRQVAVRKNPVGCAVDHPCFRRPW